MGSDTPNFKFKPLIIPGLRGPDGMKVEQQRAYPVTGYVRITVKTSLLCGTAGCAGRLGAVSVSVSVSEV